MIETFASSSHLEGYGGRRFRPRCASCAAVGIITPHPEAMQPAWMVPSPDARCPVCGALAGECGPYDEQPAIVPGVAAAIGRMLMRIGRAIRNLAERISQ